MTEHDVRRFDHAACVLAYARMKTEALALTESDFDQLAIVSPRLEADAREALTQAQLAIVRAHALKSTAQTPKSRLTRADLQLLADGLLPVLRTFVEKLKTLETSNANLEERCVALELRLLELESRTVTYADR
jgi:hypothetical protein